MVPSTFGGLATPNTPPAVAFYLDQTSRVEAMSAYTAAVAMYRAAMESFLHERGFTSGRLKAKIDALVEADPKRSLGGTTSTQSIST